MANEQQRIIDEKDITKFYETYVPEKVESLLKTLTVSGALSDWGNIKIGDLTSSTAYVLGAFTKSTIGEQYHPICLVPYTNNRSEWWLHAFDTSPNNTVGTASDSIDATVYYIDVPTTEVTS